MAKLSQARALPARAGTSAISVAGDGRVRMAARAIALSVAIGFAALCSACAPDASQDGRLPDIPYEEDLRIDGHEFDLVRIGWLGVSPTGTIVMLQSQDHGFRFFDAAGRDLGTVGREGEGPGEFIQPVRAGWIADTLWVSDTRLFRVTLISPALEVVRMFRHPSGGQAAPDAIPAQDGEGRESDALIRAYGRTYPYAVYAGDTLLIKAEEVVGPSLDSQAQDPLLRMSRDGAIDRVVAFTPRLIDEDLMVSQVVEDGFVFAYIPYLTWPTWSVAADGGRIATLTADVTDPDAASFHVTVTSWSGEEIVDRAYPVEPMPIPQAIMDSALQLAVARRDPNQRPAMIAMLRERAPSHYPPVRGLIVASDGRTWVELRSGTENNLWLVLDADGDPSGRLTLPADVDLRVADATYLYAVHTDELGVESAVRYRIVDR